MARGCRRLEGLQGAGAGEGSHRPEDEGLLSSLYRGLEKLKCCGASSAFRGAQSLPAASCGIWGCFVPWEVRGSSHQSPGGCEMLSFGDQGGFAMGMGPQPGACGHVIVERRMLLGPCHWCRPTGSVPGLASGCCKSDSDCAEQRSCSYLWISNGGCEKRKRKSPSGSFHQQFTAMTTVPIPSLRSSSPSIPRTLPTHPVTRFSLVLPV